MNGAPDIAFSLFLVSFVMMISWVLLQITTVVLLDSFIKASSMIEHDEDTNSRAKKSKVDESANPLEPLLKKLSEDFTDDHDLSARLEKLFKVNSAESRLILSNQSSLHGTFVNLQVLDTDKSGYLTPPEFIASMRKLVRK